MKLIHASPDIAEIEMMRALLEREGIAVVVKNTQLTGFGLQFGFANTQPELWVIHDADYERARVPVEEWRSAEVDSLEDA